MTNPVAERPALGRSLSAAASLCHREIVRFFRQRNRVIGAVGQPILFWLLFGAGLHQSFRVGASDQSFLAYYFPGTLVLILLFTAIFATISIIEDRKEGFLQAVLVAPIPRWSIVLGKVLGGSLIAMFQGVIFLCLAMVLDVSLHAASVAGIITLLFVSAISLTSLGFVIAWRMDSTQGFHAIMNLALMPMWLLSGAFFPVPRTDGGEFGQIALHWVMRLNPLTYAVAGVRGILYRGSLPESIWMPSLATCWMVTGGFAFVMFAAASRVARQRTKGDLL